MVLGAVERDQHMTVQTAELPDAVRSLQFIEYIVEHLVELAGLDRVRFRADLAVSGDFGHAEQRLTVRSAPFFGKVTLMLQKRWALHEEDRERSQPKIRHRVLRVGPGPPVRQRQAAAAQRGQKAVQGVQDTHRIADRAEPPGLVDRFGQFVPDCGQSDSVSPEEPAGRIE